MILAEYILGFISTILLIISLFLGWKIIIKYREHKIRAFIFVGITSIVITEPWWPQIIDFYLEILNLSKLTNGQTYIIGVVGLPIGIFTWLFAFTDLVYKEKQVIILVISGVSGILYDVFLLIFVVYIDPNLNESTWGFNNSYIVFGYLLACSITILTTGLLFARESLIADDPRLKLKGKLIIIAILSYVIAGMIDTILFLNYVAIYIDRGLLLLSSLSFYGGFLLPSWMENLLLKNDKNDKLNI